MSYAKINVYGSDACQVRLRTALVLAIQAAMDGKRVLLAEIGSNSLRMMLPSKLVFDGDAELFSITGIEDDRLLVAISRKPDLGEQELGKFAADRELMICACNGVSKKDRKSKTNKVLAGGYDGIMLQDTAALSEKLPKALIVSAIPDPLPKHFAKVRELAQAEVAAFANGTYEMPLINYTRITLPEEQEENDMWHTCRQLLDKMDYTNQVEAPEPTHTHSAIDQALSSDGSDRTPITEQLPAPDVDLVGQVMGGHKKPAQVVEETTAQYEQRYTGHMDEFKANSAAADQQLEEEIAQTQDYWQKEEESRDTMAQVRKDNLETRKAALDEEAQTAKQATEEVKAQAQALANEQKQQAKLREQRIAQAAEERVKFKEDFANKQAKQAELEERQALAVKLEKENLQKAQKSKQEAAEKQKAQAKPKEKERSQPEKQQISPEARLLARQKKKRRNAQFVDTSLASAGQATEPVPVASVEQGAQGTQAPVEASETEAVKVAEVAEVAEVAKVAKVAEVAEVAEVDLIEIPDVDKAAQEQEQATDDLPDKRQTPNKRLLEAAQTTQGLDLKIAPTTWTEEALEALKAIGGEAKDDEAKDDDEGSGNMEPVSDQGVPKKKVKRGAGPAKKKLEAFVPHAESFSIPVLINTEAITAHVKFKEAAEILAEEHYSERHPDYPPVPKEEDEKGKPMHEQFKDILHWYQNLPKSQLTSEAQREVALLSFKFTSDAKEVGNFSIYKVATEFAINTLTGYKQPDFDFLILWYRHAVWLAHFHIKNNDPKAASATLLSLLEALTEAKKIFLAQDIPDQESVFSMFLGGLILLATDIEEMDTFRANDNNLKALRSYADSLLGNLEEKYKASITEGVGADTAKEEAGHGDGDGDGNNPNTEAKKVADKVTAARDAFGDM